ncbi:hypothetical protein DMH04_33385 [Kibdelosporangium aridum]|uniref:Nucleoside phosphorylase domain-containing protein n=1 Tax=Kibdelosporangium aridum TaxID=2030 RepID=A0A428Z141_KIBAR|nr:5'-methylthioadenosine/S-adenosylhomocysteine nucleosidase [Kibdelosporangium aridum]RSM78558.1 hypothetical protein DMH04_33385 [Kibdelosporangium aridum]
MIIVLTALELEYNAVREQLTDFREHRHRHGTRFEVGRIKAHPGTEVAVAATGMGNLSAAALTERAVEEFRPAAMLFMGIAGGLKTWLQLGDVVFATSVYAYQGGRSEDESFRVRPRSWEISHDVGQAARQVARAKAWYGLLPGGDLPEVHFAPIAAGDVLLDSRTSSHARVIEDSYNDAAAVEMEGAGFAQAGHLTNIPFGLIRGISDFANGQKSATDSKGWQEIAAANAAAFTVSLAALVDDARTTGEATDGEPAAPTIPPIHNTNIANDNARVGQQIGVNFGRYQGMEK